MATHVKIIDIHACRVTEKTKFVLIDYDRLYEFLNRLYSRIKETWQVSIQRDKVDKYFRFIKDDVMTWLRK